MAERQPGDHGLNYTWKGKPLREAPKPSDWQSDWYHGPTRAYVQSFYQDHDEELPVHYMNRRFVSQVIGTQNDETRVKEKEPKAVKDNKGYLAKLQTAAPNMTVNYYEWERPVNRDMNTGGFGYFVRISYGNLLRGKLESKEFHIRRVGDEEKGWWERLMPVDYPDDYDEPRRNDGADITVHFYTFDTKPADHADQRVRFFRADPEINVYKAYSLRTAREASRLYADLRVDGPRAHNDSSQSRRAEQEIKGRELLVHLPPNESERMRMSHWADVKQMEVFHPRAGGDRTITARTHRCEAIMDWDMTSLHYLNWKQRPIPPDYAKMELKWKEGRHSDWGKMRLEWASDPQKQVTEFWVEFEKDEEERRLWVYSVEAEKWYTVESRKRVQIVDHVRAEMAVKKGVEYPKDQRWDAVESGFDGSKNPVYLFCLSNSLGILLDRMIVKPSIRTPTWERYEDLNDAFGIDTRPREVCINKAVDAMDDDSRDLFTNCIHYSFRYFGGVETWFMYLAYEDGGSLLALLRSHIAGIEKEQRIRRANPEQPRQDYRVYLPEIFLWCVFERLVRACYALRKERVALDKQYGLVHHDLKPSNILLRKRPGPYYQNVHNIKRNKRDRPEGGAEPPVRYESTQGVDRAYPIPILADLEYCYRLHHSQILWALGTPGFIAPEQYGPYPASPLRTDIFQIGCVLYALMRNRPHGMTARTPGGETITHKKLRRSTNAPQFVSLNPQDFDVRGSITREENSQSFGHMYSQNLMRLVDWCLQKHASDRPDINHLLRQVREGLQAYDQSLGKVLERKLGDKRVHPWFSVEHRKDQFEIGSSLVGKKKAKKPSDRRGMSMWGPYGENGRTRFTHWQEGISQEEEIIQEQENVQVQGDNDSSSSSSSTVL